MSHNPHILEYRSFDEANLKSHQPQYAEIIKSFSECELNFMLIVNLRVSLKL